MFSQRSHAHKRVGPRALFPQTPQDSRHLPSPPWWCGLLLGEEDCAGPVRSFSIVWAGNSGVQVLCHETRALGAHASCLAVSFHCLKDYG